MHDRRSNVELTRFPGATTWTARWPGWLLLWCGWLIPQALLLGPALVGRTVMAPVEMLNLPGVYLPHSTVPATRPHIDSELWDLVEVAGPVREFCATEMRAGRLPIWEPANFAGAPFASWPKYSPFELVYALVHSPVILAWIQLLQSLMFGCGVWWFLRRELDLSYWPSALCGWCAPLTGFVTLWQGFPIAVPVYFLPWMLIQVRHSTTRPWGPGNALLAALTAIMLLCGGSDVGGLVLLTTGLYAVWLLIFERRRGGWGFAASSALGLSSAWLVGFMLAAVYLAPLAEYVASGSRMQARSAGQEERPPIGWRELGPVLLPNMYGSSRADSLRVAQPVRPESSSTAYAGLLALLWLAPLAWCDAKRRQQVVFFSILAALAMAWPLDLPGVVQVMRQKPLNALSFNRWVFATSLSVLVLAAIGLEQLRAPKIAFRPPCAVPIALAAVFGCFCLYRIGAPPEPLAAGLKLSTRTRGPSVQQRDQLLAAQSSFENCYALGAALSAAALVGWFTTFRDGPTARRTRLAVAALLPAELLWFAAHETRQGDRSLYFPRVAALQKLASLPRGRIWGVNCLPPDLNLSHGLEDIRGYDAVDPALFVRLFLLACDPAHKPLSYAKTLSALPKLFVDGGDVKLHPVANLLNVRYLITRLPPPGGLPVIWHEGDYWILENRDALPRAFVPRTARRVESDDEALKAMGSSKFAPREVAFVTDGPALPAAMEGTAAVRYDSPTRAQLDADMRTGGIVVVSDMWDPGWRAQLDGLPCPIERVDVALRGLRIPAGRHSVEMIYDPLSVRRGLQISAAGALLWLVWALAIGITTATNFDRAGKDRQPSD